MENVEAVSIDELFSSCVVVVVVAVEVIIFERSWVEIVKKLLSWARKLFSSGLFPCFCRLLGRPRRRGGLKTHFSPASLQRRQGFSSLAEVRVHLCFLLWHLSQESRSNWGPPNSNMIHGKNGMKGGVDIIKNNFFLKKNDGAEDSLVFNIRDGYCLLTLYFVFMIRSQCPRWSWSLLLAQDNSAGSLTLD